ncbi:FERM domain-containing protein 5 [Lucilia cuprina]|uniref:FERM domain-containing protein 5 n=1 Tax=Lucilia cuprina TaxID=7375 RepID=UPI001F060E99|nr:FERM domain-containing protein 5 [Lucilia cuprina]
MELHKKRQPYQDPSVAIDEFMGIARGLETYGIDPHPVKDHRGSQLYIGINYSGISTFISGKRSQHFRWNEVHKINFEGKMFIAHLSYTDASREPDFVYYLLCCINRKFDLYNYQFQNVNQLKNQLIVHPTHCIKINDNKIPQQTLWILLLHNSCAY